MAMIARQPIDAAMIANGICIRIKEESKMKRLFLFWLCAMMIIPSVLKAEDAREECERYRQENAMRDSISAQSYVALTNLQRARYQVSELTLSTQKRKAEVLLYLSIGALAILGLIGWGTYQLIRRNRKLKEQRDELEEAKQRAEHSIFTKNLFLSNMSHEIRTPLNALSGFSSILTESGIDMEIRQQCNEIISQNSELLVKLIDDVVDLSNLEKGNMQFHFAEQEVVSLCRKVVDTVERIKQTAADVRFTSEPEELTLYTDEARLQQLLINLLINATKFTTEGSITLSLAVRDGMALFSVTDTGCGIAPDQRDKVFNRFEKLNESAQGTGLGLSICRLIIERFGGRIWIDPDYSNGTRFCFTHPIKPQTTADNKPRKFSIIEERKRAIERGKAEEEEKRRKAAETGTEEKLSQTEGSQNTEMKKETKGEFSASEDQTFMADNYSTTEGNRNSGMKRGIQGDSSASKGGKETEGSKGSPLLGILLLISLLSLPTQFAKAQEPTKIDSLRKVIKAMPHTKERLEQQTQLTQASQTMPNGIEDARELVKEAELQQEDSIKCIGITYIINHLYTFQDNQIDSIRIWCRKGLPLAKERGMWKYYFAMQRALTNAYTFADRFEYALEESKVMLAEAERIDYTEGIINSYFCMGVAYQGSKRWKEALEMYRKAHSLLNEDITPSVSLNLLLQMSDYMSFNGRYAELNQLTMETEEIINRSCSAYPQLKPSMSYYYLIIECDYSTYYSYVGELEQARLHLRKAAEYRKQTANNLYDKCYFEALTFFHLNQGQMDKALAYNDSVLSHIKINHLQEDDYILALAHRADIHFAMGQYEKALPLYQKSNQKRDSLNQIISERQMKEIKEMYEMDRLELEEAQMKQKVRWALLGIAIAILLLLIYFYMRFLRVNRLLKAATEETLQAKQISEEANDMKRRFLATMSHAIRVPLHSVVGFSQLLATDPDLSDEERAEYGEIVRFNTEQLMFLVNSVLDLSRLEAGMTKWQLADYDLILLMRDAAMSVQMKYPSIHLDFTCPDTPWPMRLDTGRMMQVLESVLVGTVTTPHPEEEKEEVHCLVEHRRETTAAGVAVTSLHIHVEGTPLADEVRQNQESSLRHHINRLTVKHFGGNYMVDMEHQYIELIFPGAEV